MEFDASDEQSRYDLDAKRDIPRDSLKQLFHIAFGNSVGTQPLTRTIQRKPR
jgi:hypothetical protein